MTESSPNTPPPSSPTTPDTKLARFPASLVQRMIKTKMCNMYINGRCAKGDNCNYAHSRSEMRSLPDLSKTTMCKAFRESGSCTDRNCRFAHHESELRSTPELYKTQICQKWKKGSCSLGDRCRFAHGFKDVKKYHPELLAHEPSSTPRPPRAYPLLGDSATASRAITRRTLTPLVGTPITHPKTPRHPPHTFDVDMLRHMDGGMGGGVDLSAVPLPPFVAIGEGAVSVTPSSRSSFVDGGGLILSPALTATPADGTPHPQHIGRQHEGGVTTGTSTFMSLQLPLTPIIPITCVDGAFPLSPPLSPAPMTGPAAASMASVGFPSLCVDGSSVTATPVSFPAIPMPVPPLLSLVADRAREEGVSEQLKAAQPSRYTE
ncbi:unnamed protein product [Vitrella brassicaformis CCMP3155]|uniref:C3H1-type domain-containing protein n=1 Tax=Vitrella brassicaformis (strain CCMP3155) TaxID=1169540 RepID=A0A0G4H6P1_VITBC|nr:unnamed protein product [Vitrella brassicaformis CCMP3155]|eukprot:CEM39344.1 unnamed protein product [Vitrella brassicaformis CCMP3155]